MPRALALLLPLLGLLGSPARAARSHGVEDVPARVAAVESIGLTVSDLDRALAFYGDVLGFERTSEIEVEGSEFERLAGVFGARARVARLRLGEEALELTEFVVPRGRPVPEDSRSNDRWFRHVAIVVRDMDRAYAHLRRHRVEHVSTGPQTIPEWNRAAGGIRAFYFRDPDRHTLELIWFPPGKGDPRWHAPNDRLFLGIDHTAIGVGNTEESLRFYRDLLGMAVTGESENYGVEQERLSGVFGARVRITQVRASRGPGIEFLEYVSPPGGRPYPADARANDLLHWQTTMRARDLGESERALRAARSTFVSPGAVAFDGSGPGFAAGLRVRDPDGHVVQLVHGP